MARVKDLEAMLTQASQGDVQVQYELGLMYDLAIGVEKNPSKAFEYYHQAAKQNHAKAQYNCAICYALAKGVAKDIATAKAWTKKARDNGYSGGSGF